MDKDEKKAVMTIKETANEYKFPEFAIRTLIKSRAFPVIQCGNRCYIVRDVFEAYLQKGGELYEPNSRKYGNDALYFRRSGKEK